MSEEMFSVDNIEPLQELQHKEYYEIDIDAFSEACATIRFYPRMVWLGWELLLPIVEKFLDDFGQGGIYMGTRLKGIWISEQCMVMARMLINHAFEVTSKKERRKLMRIGYVFLEHESKMHIDWSDRYPKPTCLDVSPYAEIMLHLQFQKYLWYTYPNDFWVVDKDIIKKMSLLSSVQAAECYQELFTVGKMSQAFVRRQLLRKCRMMSKANE